jgi:dTDP-4-amino-4,6-dideoxygalactose transaminase
LHLALVSWGVGPGDVVPVSTFTFAATVNAIRYVGAEPYFIDCDRLSGNMSADLLARALDELRDRGSNVPVVVPVDLFGKCVDYTSISTVTTDFGTRLLCDAAESFGATFEGKAAGSFGDASVISFNGNKIMTTSGGGMLLTDDQALAEHVRKLSTQAREPVAHYEHNEVGYNYRLSNILAALGRAQLVRLDDMISRRRSWRQRYRALFAGTTGVRILGGDNDQEDNCWLTPIVVDSERTGWTAADLSTHLAGAGIESRPLWKPMHLQPVCRDYTGMLDGSSEEAFASGLTLPAGSSMTETQFLRIERAIGQMIAS